MGRQIQPTISNEWGKILTTIFGFRIEIIKDYESDNKPIKDLYSLFKKEYKIPINFLDNEINNKYIQYYFSENEIKQYYSEWIGKSAPNFECYNFEQYKIYEQITIENSHIDTIQLDHYFDEGCVCKACSLKRADTVSKILRGVEVKNRIVHMEAKTELIKKRVNRANKINQILTNLPTTIRGKDFKNEMNSIVHKRK